MKKNNKKLADVVSLVDERNSEKGLAHEFDFDNAKS